jgi:lipopolysaccharide export system permease protein
VRILSRYLLREHVGPFAFAFGALTGLMILNQVARQFSNLIGKGLPWSVILEVFGLSLPFIFAMTLPMAVLVAVLHAFSRLGADSEVTALKASGVHLVRFVAPAVVAGAIMACAVFLFLDQVLPRSNHKLKTLLVDIARKKPTFELKEQQINEVVPGQLFLRAGRIDQAADRMRDIVIYDLSRDDVRRTIYADSGYIRFNDTRTDLHLTLFDGYIHDYDRTQAGTFRRIFYRTDHVRVRNVSNELQRTGQDNFRGDREMSVCEMEEIVRGDFRAVASMAAERVAFVENDLLTLAGVTPPRGDTSALELRRRSLTTWYCAALGRVTAALRPRPAEAAVPQQSRDDARLALPPARSVAQAPAAARPGPPPAGARRNRVTPDYSGDNLRSQLALLEQRRAAALQHAASFQVEIHKKYAIALSCLVFVLIGAPVALRFPRGGIGLVIGASVVIFGFYYIGLIGGETFADRLIVSPFWAMWGPNLTMATAGLVLFARLGRETASHRGGGIAELLERASRRLRGGR